SPVMRSPSSATVTRLTHSFAVKPLPRATFERAASAPPAGLPRGQRAPTIEPVVCRRHRWGGNCMRCYAKLAAAAAFSISAVPVAAHHSNSAYQVDQIITLEGTVKEWRWMNPHTWLVMTVEGSDGK